MEKKTIGHHVKHMFAATSYSLQGIATAAKSEISFIQEIIVLLALPLAAWLYGIPALFIVLVFICWIFVMALELLNMAIEAICNLVSPDFHPLVKIAKDAGSAAVFLAVCANIIFWFYLMYTYW